jgi:hypothetical protein
LLAAPPRRRIIDAGTKVAGAVAIEWLRDGELAKAAALKQRKPILVDVYKDH